MNLLLSFAPFFVFAVGAHLGWTAAGLWAAAVLSLFLIAQERFAGRSLKILETGTLILFAALALFTTVTRFEWTIPLVLLIVAALVLAFKYTAQPSKAEARLARR